MLVLLTAGSAVPTASKARETPGPETATLAIYNAASAYLGSDMASSQESPAQSESTSTPAQSTEPVMLGGQTVQVFGAVNKAAPLPGSTDLPDQLLEPSIADASAYHSSVVQRSNALNDAPLLTSKHRDEAKAKAEAKRSEKWPTTTIRIKFSDRTQIQSTFPSTSRIQPLYDFVRSALNETARAKPFVLYQPPRLQFPEHPVSQPKKKGTPYKANAPIAPANYGPVRGASTTTGGTGGSETLLELGLVPQSVLLVRFQDDEMNVSDRPAPLLPELLSHSAPLPESTTATAPTESTKPKVAATGEKKIPKWLQKGLMKRP